MFLRDDAADKQMQRQSSFGEGVFQSFSSYVTTDSVKPAPPSDAMLQSLIRDLSFWDATPPLSASSQSSLSFFGPRLPIHQPQHQQQQHERPPQQLLRRGSSANSSSNPEFTSSTRSNGRNSNGSGSRRQSTGGRSSSSSSRNNSNSNSNSNKGTINEHHESSAWQPLPTPVWKGAVDPMSGRTYWYDSVTRRTQWEKPTEVRQMEKQKKSQKRKKERAFFQIMENNIMKSLSRGELVPGVHKAKMEPTGPPLEPLNTKVPLNARNIRTLSRMDNTILAELRDDVVSPEEFQRAIKAQQQQHQQPQQQPQQSSASASSSSTRTKPRSSSRGRPPLPGATLSSRSINAEDRSRSRSRSRRSRSDSRESNQQNSQQQPIVPATTSNTQRLPPQHSPPSRGEDNGQGSSSNNTPPRNISHGEGLDTLAGEHLLDGNNLRAEIQTMADNPLDAAAINNKNHVRRNTGGTIYVDGTMSNPNVDATIKCVCGVYRAHLVQAASERERNRSPVSVLGKSHLDMDIYNDRYHLPPLSRKNKNKQQEISNTKLPSLLDIVEFYQEFFKRSQMEFDTIIMSLIYVERLIKTTEISPGPENWRSIIFACMVLASKVWDDLSMWNVDFSNVASAQSQGMSLFTLQRVNQLELILLKSLGFDVRVPASEYAKYYFLIRTMLMRSGLLVGAAKPLGNEAAKGLENRTSQYQDSKLGGTKSQSDRRTQSMYDYSWLDKPSQEKTTAGVQ